MIVVLTGKLMRKIFFGQLRPAEMEVTILIFRIFHKTKSVYCRSVKNIYLLTNNYCIMYNVFPSKDTAPKITCISHTCSFSVFKITLNISIDFFITASDRAVMVRSHRDMSSVHCLQRRFQSQICGVIHPTPLPQVFSLAGRRQS